MTDPSIAPGAKSEVQECAISISLLMFGIILERFLYIIKESLSPNLTLFNNQLIQNTQIITLDGENIVDSSKLLSNNNNNKGKQQQKRDEYVDNR